jgi:hypothetical protein
LQIAARQAIVCAPVEMVSTSAGLNRAFLLIGQNGTKNAISRQAIFFPPLTGIYPS